MKRFSRGTLPEPSRHEASAGNDPRLRVRAGAAFLDQARPKWYREVDPSLVDVRSLRRCVLAQLHHGRYDHGLDALNLDGTGYGFGFAATLDEQPGPSGQSRRHEDAMELNAAWREAIERRRSTMP